MSETKCYKVGNITKAINQPTLATDNPLSDFDEIWIFASEQEAKIERLREALGIIERRAEELLEWAVYKDGMVNLHITEFRDKARSAREQEQS